MLEEKEVMPDRTLVDFLKRRKINFSTINHTPAYTASQTAQTAHISGKNMAKIVIVKLDGRLTMVVMPAHARVDFNNLRDQTKARKVELAHEYEFSDKFPGCELGAMPPLGEMYNMQVIVADSLSHQPWLAFNAGSHSELIRMSTEDFLQMVHPKLLPQC